jgi:hypothetical protein
VGAGANDEGLQRLVLTHDCGFFSNCSVLLEEIQRMDGPFQIDTTGSFSMYRSDPTTDVYEKYFQPSTKAQVDKVHFDRWMCARDYTQLPLERFLPSITQWFTFRDFVTERSFSLQAKYGVDPDRTLAVFYRGTDKKTENPLEDPQTIARLVNKLAAGYDSVIVQTDDQSIYEHLVREIDRDVIVFSELPRYSSDSDPHTSLQFHDPELLEDFLSAVLLITRCKTVILTTSNVSLWIALFRGRTKGLFHISDFGFLRKRLMFLELRSRWFYVSIPKVLRVYRKIRSELGGKPVASLTDGAVGK